MNADVRTLRRDGAINGPIDVLQTILLSPWS